MAEFRGSISNFPPAKRVLLLFMVVMAPVLALLATFYLFLTVPWWPYVLVLDLAVAMIAISLSGLVIKDHRMIFGDDELIFRKGWARGRIPYRNLIKVYRVMAAGKNAIMIIFMEPSSKKNPNRCLTVEQTFSRGDRDRMMSILKSLKKGYSFKLIDRANLDIIERDKRSLDWVPV